ncbi:MAG: DUF2934 domain-containing protein [Verrucomicrobiota bacterium]
MSIETVKDNGIAALAQQLWEQAGQPGGRDLEFWLQAEASLLTTPTNHTPGPSDTGETPVPASAAAKDNPLARPQNDIHNKRQKVQSASKKVVARSH